MQTLDIHGKTLSNAFQSAITASAQFVKPRVVIDLQDGRHLSNVVITTNDAHANSSSGNLGFYFNKDQVVNGFDYEGFSWAVAGAKDNKGRTITASGKYRAMPSDLVDNFKYGWWSGTKSNSSCQFTTNPYVDISFDSTTVNKIRIVTSRTLGQVATLTLAVSRANATTVLNETITFNTAEYEFEKVINLNDTYTDIARVLVTVTSTKNPNDYARILSVSPIYQLDASDYVIESSANRIRDLHETSLPIAGSAQSTCNIILDNTDKKFNFLNTSSDYGQFLQKDIKVEVSNGWKAYESNSNTVQSFITSNMASSGDTYIYLNNATEFANGDTGNTGLEANYYIVTVDPGKFAEEKILVKKKIDNVSLEIQERGYAGTDAVAHTSGTTITFDPFEYVPVGTFFIEEMSSSSSDMTVALSLSDRSKFLNDKITEKGFFRQDITVADAIEDLLYFTNFPNHKIIKYERFADSPVLNDAILHLKFNDTTNSTSNTYVQGGLRYRVYQPPEGWEYTVKDMQLDAVEKQLSDLDRALGLYAIISPSYSSVKSNVSLSSYSLSSDAAGLNNSYYQGVFDGYYIPDTTNASQEIGIELDEGGARLYIDDTLVIDAWNESTSLTYFSTTRGVTAGAAYKIRLEFYHTQSSQFSINLTKGAGRTVIGSDELLTNIVLDHIGVRDASYTTTSNTNRQRNNAIPTTFVAYNSNSSITWNTTDKSVNLSNTVANTSVVDSFVRLPYDSSWDVTSNTTNPDRNWTIEFIFKAPDGPYGNSGEYISSFSNSSSDTGIEFFYIGSTNHGVKLKTVNLSNSAVGTATLTSNIAMPSSNSWNHIIATYNHSSKKLSYMVNGTERANTTLAANVVPEWGQEDFTFGGRGAGFVSGVGVTKPTSSISNSGINLAVDEFVIYNKSMTEANAKKRYIETQIQELKKFPFLYGLNDSIYQIIQNISFSDLGRMYIDELGNARYDHYYAFFESSIDQHSNVQKTISDSNFITEATVDKTLQVNSVIVKVAGLTANSLNTEPIWRAPDPTTLGIVTLGSSISNTANSVPALGFDIIPFPKAGYIVIDNEIIKYSNTNSSNFLSVERGALGTTAASHNANSKIREVRYFNFEFDKSPSLNIKNPFITGILFEDPDEINILHWSFSPFKGNLIISASDNSDANTVVFAEGTNPVTSKVAFTSIAGIPVQVTENKTQIIEQKSVNSENRRKYGLKEVTIDSAFITDASQAQTLADFIISKLAEPIPILNITTTLIPTLQVGDRIRISTLDQFDIINSDYWVTSISDNAGGSFTQQMVLRKVV
jgi:hypothetical protein